MLLLHPFPCLLLIVTRLSWATGKISSTSQRQIYSFSALLDRTVCKTTSGLTKKQTDLCMKRPDVTKEALAGIVEAVRECQHQFQDHRWNCSSLSTKSGNPYTSSMFQKGYRETAFAYAISSAGAAIAVAKACSQGKLINCNCAAKTYKAGSVREDNAAAGTATWKLSGCSHNVRYGIRFSKKFLDVREAANDLHSRINLRNNHVGRMAVKDNVQVMCKCHGLSGSCEMKTCWKTVPSFRRVGVELKQKYAAAILVDQSNVGNGKRRKHNNMRPTRRRKLKFIDLFAKGKKKKELSYNLLYYQKSPHFCEPDQSLDVAGTVGRRCNLTSSGPDNCSTLCCGRGYDKTIRKREDKICKFNWCCRVDCVNYTVSEEVTVCK